MQIINNLLDPNKYSRPQIQLKKVTKVAVHYVGNAASTAIANRNYFNSLKSGKVYASSHYIIGLDGEIIRCVPENEISYCTNQANSYSISIECCHPKADGKFNEKTYNSLLSLCVDICKRYNLNPAIDIIRHYDVTGKKCPLYWVNNVDEYIKFKNNVKTQLNEEVEMVTKTKININKKEYTVNRILKDGKNYIELSALKQAGFDVGYNESTKVPSFGVSTVEDKFLINGEEKRVNKIMKNGENYVRLRDLKGILNLEYDADNKLVTIRSKT